MVYPTMEEVERADQEQLCRWYRFLPSPGTSALTRHPDIFNELLKEQSKIIDRIIERWSEGGRFTPGLSKKIGWQE
jgi:hypothetical protein